MNIFTHSAEDIHGLGKITLNINLYNCSDYDLLKEPKNVCLFPTA